MIFETFIFFFVHLRQKLQVKNDERKDEKKMQKEK